MQTTTDYLLVFILVVLMLIMIRLKLIHSEVDKMRRDVVEWLDALGEMISDKKDGKDG